MKTKLVLLFILFAAAANAQLLLSGTQVKKDGTTITTNANKQLTVNTANIATVGYVDSSAGGWSLTGNTGTDPDINFVGTTDSVGLAFRTGNIEYAELKTVGQLWLRAGYDTTRYGVSFLPVLTADIAIGDSALTSKVYSSVDLETSHSNIAIGHAALKSLVKGVSNLAIGHNALKNTNGTYTAGDFFNGGGYENTAVGNFCMQHNTTGVENAAFGVSALHFNTTGGQHAAFGLGALNTNTTGSGSTAIGCIALFFNTTGDNNTAVGLNASKFNTTGSFNTTVGNEAGRDITTGISNTAVGQAALQAAAGNANAAVGSLSLLQTTGQNNVGIGFRAGSNNTSGSYQIFIDSYDFGTRSTYKQDTTNATIYGTTGADSSTQKVKIGGKLGINDGTNTVIGKRFYLVSTAGYGAWSNPEINTTANDSATINKVSGRFRMDTSGSAFILINSFITANSIIDFDLMGDLTSTGIALVSYTCTSGSATVTFYDIALATGVPELKTPAANQDVSFKVEN